MVVARRSATVNLSINPHHSHHGRFSFWLINIFHRAIIAALYMSVHVGVFYTNRYKKVNYSEFFGKLIQGEWIREWCSLVKSFNAEVGSQKHSWKASFSTSDAVLTSLIVESLCSSLVANNTVLYVPYILKTFPPLTHRDMGNVFKASGTLKTWRSDVVNALYVQLHGLFCSIQN